jgi:hypothetical protein
MPPMFAGADTESDVADTYLLADMLHTATTAPWC